MGRWDTKHVSGVTWMGSGPEEGERQEEDIRSKHAKQGEFIRCRQRDVRQGDMDGLRT